MDLVQVARMARLLAQQPEIVHRVFTTGEQRYCDAKRTAAQHYAVRFAAKEAVLKALGTGLGAGMEWTEVEVVRSRDGRPSARLHGGVAEGARVRGLSQLELSLSHTDQLAIAQAVALFSERGSPAEGRAVTE